MNSTWKARQIERRDDVKAIQEVLDVLNRMDTSVTVTDRKYIIMQNGKKRYEITMFDHDATIRAFDGDTLGAVRCVLGEGIVPKAKLWLLKFELESATEPKPFEVFVNKVKTVKSEIDVTNDVLTFLSLPGTKVNVLHETTLMKKYEVIYDMCGEPGKVTIEFDGSIVKYNEKKHFDKQGYMSWKWGWVRKTLERNIIKAKRQHQI